MDNNSFKNHRKVASSIYPPGSSDFALDFTTEIKDTSLWADSFPLAVARRSVYQNIPQPSALFPDRGHYSRIVPDAADRNKYKQDYWNNAFNLP